MDETADETGRRPVKLKMNDAGDIVGMSQASAVEVLERLLEGKRDEESPHFEVLSDVQAIALRIVLYGYGEHVKQQGRHQWPKS